MKTLLLVQTSSLTYILNDIELSREDFCLLLELFGFDVPRNTPHGEFWQKSLLSLSRIEELEFYFIFDQFITYTQEDKDYWRELVGIRKLTEADFKLN